MTIKPSALLIGLLGAAAGSIIILWQSHQRRKCDDTSKAKCKLAKLLGQNTLLFHKEELKLMLDLILEEQEFLFEGWSRNGVDDERKKFLVNQLVNLDKQYPGGLVTYIRNARQLLDDSRIGRNPYDGYTPHVPDGESLDMACPRFMELESLGVAEIPHTAFVLVAGGLGERLGYSGIKLSLPTECATSTSFLALYCQYIAALQASSRTPTLIPLVIMTSDDTHRRTQLFLSHNSYFGLKPEQVTLLKQEKVACLADGAAHLALETGNRWQVQTKPHGHGDVHALLFQHGVARSWQTGGIRWVCFFQDTNALVFRALLPALGLSATSQYDFNSLAVPRRAREAIGAITRLRREADGSEMTINVEYNQLDPLLRATSYPEGDINDASGFSPFPGNINQLIIRLESYLEVLERTHGLIPEFVNPKYKDANKMEFKSSTRLECMMQDYPKALPQSARVGFLTIKQVWATYSPVKNSPADARAKVADGGPSHSATSAEFDIYRANSSLLQELTGAILVPPVPEVGSFNGLPVDMYPRVVMTPSFAPTLSAIKSKIRHGSLTLHPGSTLILDGADIRLEGAVEVEGALLVKAPPGVEVVVGDIHVRNRGMEWAALGPDEATLEEERIRGFRVLVWSCEEFKFKVPGLYYVPSRPPSTDKPDAAPGMAGAQAASSSTTAPAPPITPSTSMSERETEPAAVASASRPSVSTSSSNGIERDEAALEDAEVGRSPVLSLKQELSLAEEIREAQMENNSKERGTGGMEPETPAEGGAKSWNHKEELAVFAENSIKESRTGSIDGLVCELDQEGDSVVGKREEMVNPSLLPATPPPTTSQQKPWVQ